MITVSTMRMLVCLVALLAPLTTPWAPIAAHASTSEVEIRVLANRADLVSDGHALIQIILPDSRTHTLA